jgi:cytochrome c biogenesis protein CcdA
MNGYPWEALGAFALGILTTVQPCPLATNVAAVSLICGWARGVRRALVIGLSLLVGVACCYAALGGLISYGAVSVPAIANFLRDHMIRIQGPLLILVGMFLCELLRFPGPLVKWATTGSWMREREWGVASGFLIGCALALSFCPTTAAIFFGMLIPLAAARESSLLFPALYGLGAGVPLLVVVVLVAKGASLAGKRGWLHFRRLCGGVLIGTGVLLSLRYVFGVV